MWNSFVKPHTQTLKHVVATEKRWKRRFGIYVTPKQRHEKENVFGWLYESCSIQQFMRHK